MIHRLDLDERLAEGSGRAVTNPQILWTLVGVGAFAFVVISLKDHRQLARYGYVCGLTGLVILGDTGAAAAVALRAERREDLDSLAGLLDSARRILEDPAADFLRRGVGGQTRAVHQRGQARAGHGSAAAARPRSAAGAPGWPR